MANTRFGNFSNLSQGKKPISDEEALAILTNLGFIGQEFIPGATSIRKVMEGKPREAVEELQDWIPGNAAYQNWLNDKPQDWTRNAIDAMIMGKPITKGAKKAFEAIERIPKGGKEGFITLTKPTGQNKLKDVIEASNAAGQTITPEIEREIRDHIGIVKQFERNPSRANQRAVVNHYDRITPEAKQVIDGYLGQEQPHGFKPEGFDNWPVQDRIKYYEDQVAALPVPLEEVVKKSRQLKNENYGGHQDYGVIYNDAMTTDDYMKALLDKEAEEKAAAEAAANRPIEMVQVEDFGNGILHNEGPAAAPQGGHRNTYDHSRQFMDTELKQVPPIDRTGMIYGDNTDAMYDIYKAWRNSKPEEFKELSERYGFDWAGSRAISKLKERALSEKNMTDKMIKAVDPYYAAGVVGDSNVRLWNKIDALKAEGKTDKEIREILKDDLNKYQGQIERFKERMPSKGHNAQFDYDGATTQTLKALPSEEARALKALGIDTPEYNDLERLGNFYRVFFPK